MNDPALTPELEAIIARQIMENRPYLIALEDKVQEVKNGEIVVHVFIRTGVVEKMEFERAFENWFKPKV
jgi:hypothetical protein